MHPLPESRSCKQRCVVCDARAFAVITLLSRAADPHLDRRRRSVVWRIS
jgi:hypothetical protein